MEEDFACKCCCDVMGMFVLLIKGDDACRVQQQQPYRMWWLLQMRQLRWWI